MCVYVGEVIQWKGAWPAFSMHTEMGVCAMSIKSLGGHWVNLEEWS